jgi:hypothetical protein
MEMVVVLDGFHTSLLTRVLRLVFDTAALRRFSSKRESQPIPIPVSL